MKDTITSETPCRIIAGDALAVVKTMDDQSVNCCVTSPPYFGLRDYGHPGQIGLEKTPEEYVAALVAVFREVKRVLQDDGTLWLNLGDSYAASGRGGGGGSIQNGDVGRKVNGENHRRAPVAGLKQKDLIGIPWLVAFALRSDGWYLRQDIIWAKPNPMPESVTDRCTKSHEYIFMFSKSPRYYYDAAAIRNPPSKSFLKEVAQGYCGEDTKDFFESKAQSASGTKSRIIDGARKRLDKQRGHSRQHSGFNDRWDNLTRDEQCAIGSNKRSVWTVAVSPFKGAHFATFPPELIKPCIMAGCPPGGTVLDPFGGSGTTGIVASGLGRKAILIEINPSYVTMAEERCPNNMQEHFA